MVLGINMLASRMIFKVFIKGYDTLGILINCNMMFYNHRALVVALTKAMYSNFMEK
jgi:hypothetical protein